MEIGGFDMTFVIAEAGINHCGSLDRALKMVERAAESGADAVKFQSFTSDRLGYDQKMADYLKTVELSKDDHEKLKLKCEKLGIEFMSTPFDTEWVDFLVKLGVKRIKVSSGKVKDWEFCKYVQGTGLPIIMSNGMCTPEQLSDSSTPRTTVLYCVSEYPTPMWKVDFRKMLALGHNHYQYGFSDHTLTGEASVFATAMGASVIERHFTLDRSLPGPDQCCSSEPDELRNIIKQMRECA
jgi:N,N'-diacetyllegionaminate synthase